MAQKEGGKKKKFIVCCVGRNNEVNYYNLEDIDIQRKEIDRQQLLECIEDAWDVDIGEPKYVLLHVRKGNVDTDIVEQELRKKLTVAQDIGNEIIYEGEIRGINDFKSWIREHMTTCIVEEPEDIRKEMYTALQEKLRRYEEDER